jgi:hypothetical protein
MIKKDRALSRIDAILKKVYALRDDLNLPRSDPADVTLSRVEYELRVAHNIINGKDN